MSERDILRRLDMLEKENEWLRRQVSGIPSRFVVPGMVPAGQGMLKVMSQIASAAGKYVVREIVDATGVFPATGNLVESDFGTLSTTDGIGANVSEIGRTAHLLPVNAYVIAQRTNRVDGSNRRLWRITGWVCPIGNGQYKVLQFIDSNNPGTPGFDTAKFSS